MTSSLVAPADTENAHNTYYGQMVIDGNNYLKSEKNTLGSTGEKIHKIHDQDSTLQYF